MPHHLVGSAEIARMLGVTRQRVSQLAAEPDFPVPEVTLSNGRIWSREAVRAWARGAGRKLFDAPADEGQ